MARSRCRDVDDGVVGQDGVPVCAPLDGRVDGPCDPGDTSAIAFSTQPLQLIGQAPIDGQQDVGTHQRVLLQFDADISDATFDRIELRAGDDPVAIDLHVDDFDATVITITPVDPMAPNTLHTLTILGGADGLAEIAGGVLPENTSSSFTTGSTL